MRKRILSFFLILVFMFSSLFYRVPISYADAPNTSYNGCTWPELYSGDVTDVDGIYNEDFKTLKPYLPPGTKAVSVNRQRFNYILWHDKHLVVYGNYSKVGNQAWKDGTQTLGADDKPIKDYQHGYYNNSDTGHPGEYRYHGFDYNGNPFTNENFINDSKNTSDLSDRVWIYKPWANNVMQETVIQSKYNAAAESGNIETQKWIESAVGTPSPIANGLDTNGKYISGTALSQSYNFLNVLSPPSSTHPGEVRMWHKIESRAKPYYQTLSTDPVQKQQPDVTVVTSKVSGPDIVIVDPSSEHDSDTIDLVIKVAATLDDGSYYMDDVQKVTHYTRYDIKNWNIKLAYAGTTKTYTAVNVKDNTAWFEFPVQLTYEEFKSRGNAITFIGEAFATYYDGKNSKTGSNSYHYGPGVDEDVPPPILLDVHPDVPDRWFDIVKFPAGDNTDLTDVETREVYINDSPIDVNTFFSGNYVFGESKVGLNKVTIKWITKDKQEFISEKYTYIYSTIPRAQYNFSGSFKENRKLTIADNSDPANAEFVLSHYPITSYSWSITRVDGSPTTLKRNIVSNKVNDILGKEPGLYNATLTVTNALGRTSKPYSITFKIYPDYPAAVICNLNNSVMARNESVTTYKYDAVSTDGDIIESNIVELWYDSDYNGSYDTLLNTWTNPAQFPKYTPTKLGSYKFVNKVTEAFGEPTLSEYITPIDKRTVTLEREFFVDNYMPMTGLYVDIPIVRPQVDVLFMMDEQLKQASLDYVINNRMNINNQLRNQNIVAKVDNWDLKTYIYSQPATTTKNTGASYPQSTITYTSNGYSGILNLTNTVDNSYWQDDGGNVPTPQSQTFSGSWTNNESGSGWTNPWEVTSSSSNPAPSSLYINSDGYSGSIPRTSTTTNYYTGYVYGTSVNGRTPWTYNNSYTAYYSGTLSKTVQIWHENWVLHHNYTGYYSGTIYKSVKQTYPAPFVNSHTKYIVYITDGGITNLSDVNYIQSNNDVKTIIIGGSAAASQATNNDFILNAGASIDTYINQAIDYIASDNPLPPESYITTQNTVFNISNDDFDQDNDPIVNAGYQYVQNKDYFDNPTGQELGTQTAYSSFTGWTTTKKDRFANVGLYTIYRKLEDRPITDSNFSNFNKTSNIPMLNILVHRIPIAQPVMTWKYNAISSLYELTFIDNSYDLDHQFSRADKGIIETSMRYRKDAGEWNYKIPTDLTWGNYTVEYQVKDLELAWSTPFVMNVNLLQVPPATIIIESTEIPKNVKMRGDATISAGEILQITSPDKTSGPLIHSNIPITSAQVLVNGTSIGVLTLTLLSDDKEYLYKTNILEYTVPVAQADGNMTVTIRANSNIGNQSKDKVDTVAVYSPIWEDYSNSRLSLIPDALAGVPSGMELSPTTAFEKPVDFSLKTSIYTSRVYVSFNGMNFYLWKNGTVTTANTPGTATTLTVNDSSYKYKVSSIAITTGSDNRVWNFKLAVVNNYPLKYGVAATFSATGYDEYGSATTTSNKHGYNPRTKVIIPNNYLLSSFRIVKVRELDLASFYYNSATGNYDDKPIGVNQLAVDAANFAGLTDGLTKGYKFEFEIDSKNFNAATDTIIIEPHFYTGDAFTRDTQERDLYWEDSNHAVYKVGEGGHAAWKTVTLTSGDKAIKNAEEAVWRGEYLIPGTTWAVPKGTTKENAKSKNLKRDIIVNFSIKGYKNGVLQFDYNLDQWPKERTNVKYPYQIGDVIRYSWNKSCLDDIESKDNR